MLVWTEARATRQAQIILMIFDDGNQGTHEFSINFPAALAGQGIFFFCSAAAVA